MNKPFIFFITSKTATPLKNTFNFNGFQISKECHFNGWIVAPTDSISSRTLHFNKMFFSLDNPAYLSTILSPYMLKKVKAAAISRKKIEHLQHLYIDRLSTPTFYPIRRTRTKGEPPAHDISGVYSMWSHPPERMTFAIHQVTHHSIYFKHLKAILLTKEYWKDYDFFSSVRPESRAIWLGHIWYGNKSLHMLQPLAKVGPFGSIFKLFVRHMWWLWLYDKSPNIDTGTRTWKIYWFLRKAWQMEVSYMRRIWGIRKRRRVFLRDVIDNYDLANSSWYESEGNLYTGRNKQLFFKGLSFYKKQLLKVFTQLLLFSNLPSTLLQSDGTLFFNNCKMYVFFCAIYHSWGEMYWLFLRENKKLETTDQIFYEFLVQTVYHDYNFDRPRQPLWKNPFLSKTFKFTGHNFVRVKNKFTTRRTDPFWIHTTYPNGRFPYNLFLKGTKVGRQSLSYRIRLTDKPYHAYDYRDNKRRRCISYEVLPYPYQSVHYLFNKEVNKAVQHEYRALYLKYNSRLRRWLDV